MNNNKPSHADIGAVLRQHGCVEMTLAHNILRRSDTPEQLATNIDQLHRNRPQWFAYSPPKAKEKPVAVVPECRLAIADRYRLAMATNKFNKLSEQESI